MIPGNVWLIASYSYIFSQDQKPGII